LIIEFVHTEVSFFLIQYCIKLFPKQTWIKARLDPKKPILSAVTDANSKWHHMCN
jgi:hypothetical protein